MKLKKLIVCAGFIAAFFPAFAAAPPNSAEQLLDRLQSAIKTKDTTSRRGVYGKN